MARAPGLIVAWRASRGLAHVLLGFLLCGLVFPCVSHRRRLAIVRWWAGGFLAALGIRAVVEGAWPTDGRRYLLASNHISWLDIFVIHSVHPVRFVSKSEVRNWPVAGYLATCAGTLYIDRARKRDTLDIGAQMLGVMAEGDAVGIFPEGTTSDGSVLLPFFSPLLQPAINCEAWIVPTGVRYALPDGAPNTALAFIGEQTFVESVLITLRQPKMRVSVRFGTPIASSGLHRRELTRLVEASVAGLLGVPVDRAWRPPGAAAASASQSTTGGETG